MIADKIENCETYYGVHPRMKEAFAFLRKCLKEPPAPGRYELAGENLYAVVFCYSPEEKEAPRLETHDWYIDIQCMVSGSEFQWYQARKDASALSAYDAKADITFYEFTRTGSRLWLKEGMFAAYFPHDAHLPGMCDGSEKECVRIVVKIKC